MRHITDVFFATNIDLYNEEQIIIKIKQLDRTKTPCILTKIASNNKSNLYHVGCHIERDNEYNMFSLNNTFGGSLNCDDIHYNHVQDIMNHGILIPPPGIDTYSVYCHMDGAYQANQSAITIFVN